MLNARFFSTIAHIRDLPTDSHREVAFAGRSNAGKSSAINIIANQKRLAFASKTPGRTQHLNFFETQAGRFLVDLPGYGFAKAPFTQQRAWQQLIGGYLADRRQLVGLVLIMDIRHPLTDLDRHLLNWFRPTGKPIHILLSKADKISRGQAMQVLRAVQTELSDAGFTARVQIFSSTHRIGLDEAEAIIRQWLDMVKPSKEAPAADLVADLVADSVANSAANLASEPNPMPPDSATLQPPVQDPQATP